MGRIYKCFACGQEFETNDESRNLYCPECRDREIEISNRKMEIVLKRDSGPLSDLVDAILEQACSDYIKAIKEWRKIIRTTTSKDKVKNAFDKIKYFSRWFKGKDFEFYLRNVEGAGLQKNVQKLLYVEIKAKREKKKGKKK